MTRDKVLASVLPENREKNEHSTSAWPVQFASIHVPFERRMQTLAVLLWVSIFVIIHPGGLILMAYTLVYTNWWYLPLLYIGWIYLDRDICNTGGRRINMVREWKFWRYYKDYFPISLIKTADLDPKKNYLLAYHPHGVLSSGTFGCFASEGHQISKLYPGLTTHLLTLRLNFMFPLFRECCLALGLCSVTKESINYLLSYPGGGKMTVLVPGGSSESLDAHSGAYVLKLKDRKGFVKLALQNGVSLVPVFAFGENDIYSQMSNPEGSLLRKIQNKVQKTLSVAPLVVNGRGVFQYSFGFLPRRRPIFVVVGAPLEAKHIVNPTQEDVDLHHSTYVDALKKLFYKYRDQYEDSAVELQIV